MAKQWHIEKGADLVPAISPFFFDRHCGSGSQETLRKCNDFSWFTVPNTLKFMQNIFFSKHQ